MMILNQDGATILMAELIVQLRERYDKIIFDTPVTGDFVLSLAG